MVLLVIYQRGGTNTAALQEGCYYEKEEAEFSNINDNGVCFSVWNREGTSFQIAVSAATTGDISMDEIYADKILTVSKTGDITISNSFALDYIAEKENPFGHSY